jgi:S1-C subfamily serine protease
MFKTKQEAFKILPQEIKTLHNLKLHQLVVERLVMSFACLVILSGCVTPIGLTQDVVLWDCGSATAETKTANCSSITDYLAGFTYSGPVRPINFSEATPHGKGGKISNFSNAKIHDFRFSYGRLEFMSIEYEDGRTYVGSVDQKVRWKSGVYNSSDYRLDGTFHIVNNLNVIKSGEVLVKKSGNTYNGSFKNTPQGEWMPDKGEYKYKDGTCTMRVKGEFGKRDLDSKYPFALNTKKEFTIFHPLASINAFNGYSETRATIKFLSKSEALDVKLKMPTFFFASNAITSIYSVEKIYSIDPINNEISISNFEWNNPLGCNSAPTYPNKKVFLESSPERAFYSNALKMKHVKDFGFQTILKSDEILPQGQLFILNLENGIASREITSKINETSKYVSGQRERYNPEYDVATARVNQASARLAQAQAQAAAQGANPNCANNIGACFLLEALKAAPTASARNNYDEALNTLQNTPTIIIEDIYSEYKVEKLKIEASKKQTLNAILIDFDRGVISRKSYPLEDSKKFTVINSEVAPTDTNKRKLTGGTSREKEVDSWMKRNINVTNNHKEILIELIDENPSSMSSGKLFKFVNNIANTPSFSSNQDIAKPTKQMSNVGDKEYIVEDSILIVDTLDGMGTGFYVTSDLVITNQHVVEDSVFVNLKTFDGNTFTGNVLNTDIATDLALLKVNVSGVPLSLESNCSVKRREEVFTVGHPKGYTYSTTRGIVSSIRVMPNPFYSAVGSKQYIQIDAAINSGNSGGPLFNKNEKVIGVNTWGRTDGQSLNFAVHCNELRKFLNKNKINL